MSNCEWLCGNNECYIRTQVKYQSRKGGGENGDGSGNTGKYWSKEGWKAYMLEAVKSATLVNCRNQIQIKNLVEKITETKNIAGELI